MKRQRVIPTCHPDKIHGGYGLCKVCYQRKYKPKNYIRNYRLRTIYGMTPEQFEQMEAAQHNLCALCQQPPKGTSRRTKRLVVDHDHETGKVRGLLCQPCNRALGWFENPEWSQRAREYLDRRKVWSLDRSAEE